MALLQLLGEIWLELDLVPVVYVLEQVISSGGFYTPFARLVERSPLEFREDKPAVGEAISPNPMIFLYL